MDDESWFLQTSQKLVHTDIFSARSWLLTAKSLFPQSFRLQIEEYALELKKKNTDECSKILNEIFREFPGEQGVWEEIEKLIHAIEHSNDPLRKAIFEGLPALTQQRMILASAESRVNIAQYCRLCIVLMKKFPDTVSQYGLELVDKLVEAEKKDPEGTPVNHYRKLLVAEVLPVMCSCGNVNVSNKHFYKWLQKSTEFYVCNFTSITENNNENAWSDLETLRAKIAVHCSWKEKEGLSKNLNDRISFMLELFRQSRTDVDGVVNRKQIFYTSLILLFEASSIYMLLLSPYIYRASCEKPGESLMFIINLDESSDVIDESYDRLPIRKSSDIQEAYQVAKEAWTILHSNEVFEKDFHHLLRRWKSDRWFWFQLFLIDYMMNSGNFESALVNLRQVEQKLGNESASIEVKIRIFANLAFVCFALKLFKESAYYIFETISLFPVNETPVLETTTNHVTSISKFSVLPKIASPISSSDGAKTIMIMTRITSQNLLPHWIFILVRCLQTVLNFHIDDVALGHMLVLSQYNWPRWRPQCEQVLKLIDEKKEFNFPLSSQYIINIDILEEIAFLKNNKSCHFLLSPNHNLAVHVTRGANEKLDEDFWKIVTSNVQRCNESIDNLIEKYLMSQRETILTSLNRIEPGRHT